MYINELIGEDNSKLTLYMIQLQVGVQCFMVLCNCSFTAHPTKLKFRCGSITKQQQKAIFCLSQSMGN